MLSIKKILLPVDFPNTSLRVIHQAATLAHQYRSEIVMLHVVTALSQAQGELVCEWRPQIQTSMANQLDQATHSFFSSRAKRRYESVIAKPGSNGSTGSDSFPE
jgi:nucleotide-binding universal stress UspA family protein